MNQTTNTFRRKLQKKKKHKPYRKCPQCGERMECLLDEGDYDGWHLWTYCGRVYFLGNFKSREHARCQPAKLANGTVRGCGYLRELFWLGGGIGRHIPHSKQSTTD